VAPRVPQPELTDLETVRALQAGDEAVFLAVVERHQAAFERVARSLCSSQAVAEEIVQEAWTAALQALPAFEGRSSLKTWLFRILVNRARTRAEREGRSVPFSALGPADGEGEEAGSFQPDGHWASPVARWSDETPEVTLLRSEALRALQTALETLPPQQRTVVTLRDVEGLESDEVCNVLGISESNQRVLLHRARLRLRAALMQYMDDA
jgi:RNA polymerase sigma-70 factor (ECF subfamily)